MKKLRRPIQLGILVLVTVIGVLHQTLGGGPEGISSIHGICPFGGIESFYSLVTRGEFVKKTFYSNLILVGGSTFLVVFLGRIFCGWICALGTLQDIFGSLGKKLFKKRYEVPRSIDKALRYLKYVVLIGIVYFTWKTGELVINSMDPFSAYSHISAGWEDLLGEYIIGFAILVVMLIASLFYERLFCRYLCPLGAYYSIIGRVSFFKIKRNENSCINCGKCDKICLAGLNISDSKEIKSTECLGCMECINICPTKKSSLDSISMNKKIDGKKVGALGVSVFFGIILVTKGLGLYATTPNSVSEILKGNPNNIRGWMTIEDISKGFDIPLEKIYSELQINKDELSPTIPIKESEGILKEKGIEFDHDKIGEVVSNVLGIKLEPEVAESGSSFEVKGSMSIESIATRSGLSLEEVRGKLELSEDVPSNIPMKELSAKYGFEMESVKKSWNK